MKRTTLGSAKAAKTAGQPLPQSPDPSARTGNETGSENHAKEAKQPVPGKAVLQSLPLGLSAEEPPQPKSDLTVPPILLEGDEPSRAAVTGQGPKSEPSPATPVAQRESGPSDLPEAYGTGRLWLTARDPSSLYAHWDLSSEQQQRYNHLSVHRHLLLRVHRESLSGPLVTELHLDPQARHCFMHVGAQAGTYLAELGYYPSGTAWHTIAASDAAVTPGAAAAEEKPVRFATLALAVPGPRNEQSSPPIGAFPAAGPAASPAWTRSTENYPEANAAQEPAPNPLQPTVVPMRLQPASLADQSAWPPCDELPQPVIHPCPPGHPFAEEPAGAPTHLQTRPVQRWTPARQRALAELIGWSRSLGSVEISSIELAKLPSPMAISSPVSPNEAPVSSLALGQVPSPEQPGFWLNVNAELVIYGATEPNAKVTIGGRPIDLRPDGSFSYRFALPDGSYQLPIAALSTQGDVRQATLDFYRGTSYSGEVAAHPQDPGLGAPSVENLD